MSLNEENDSPEPSLRRQKLNNFLNNLFELEIERENQSVYFSPVEIKETNQAICIRLELPRITKRQIYLELPPSR